MCADDTIIYFSFEDFDAKRHVETEINKKLERVNIWLKLNKLSLNIKKTKLMILGKKQKRKLNKSIFQLTMSKLREYTHLVS